MKGRFTVGLSLAAVIVGALAMIGGGTKADQRARLGYKPRDVLVKFNADAPENSRTSLREDVSGTRLETFASGAERWHLEGSYDTAGAISALRENEWVEYIEPNYALEALSTTPDDPNFGNQWALNNTGQEFWEGVPEGSADADIDAPEAWDISTGDPNHRVVVAVIDVGVKWDHPDLEDNAWLNDDPYNIYDDDGNGFRNDLHGWNFADGDASTKPVCAGGPVWFEDPNNPFYSTFPGISHGTHVAGIIGAVGNNGIGVAGVNWNAAIMPVRIWGCCNPADPNCPGGFLSSAVAAIDYAVNEGADVINASWGIGKECSARPAMCAQTLYDAIKRAQDREVLFVSASGNAAQNIDSNSPGDLYNYAYPTNYDLDGIISVHSTDADDDGFGNYGTVSVDLGAPGVNILSTLYDSSEGDIYDFRSGTSMAAPHVAGVASLIRTLNPKIPAKLSKQLIMDHADSKASLSGMSVTEGRLNAFNVLDHR